MNPSIAKSSKFFFWLNIFTKLYNSGSKNLLTLKINLLIFLFLLIQIIFFQNFFFVVLINLFFFHL